VAAFGDLTLDQRAVSVEIDLAVAEGYDQGTIRAAQKIWHRANSPAWRRLESLFAHDLIRKPASTFRDHALEGDIPESDILESGSPESDMPENAGQKNPAVKC
jgi:hypothetical protein